MYMFEISEKMAEMFGIILGDGHVRYKQIKGKTQASFTITLNFVDSYEYVLYVKKMITDLFGKCGERKRNGCKSGDLVVYGKNVVEFLIKNGIFPGNKVKNQVDVPSWIKENNAYRISCLRGLFDTDGSFFIKKRDGCKTRIGITFRNYSRNLLANFRELCNNLCIKTTETGTAVNIATVEDARKFIDIINPFKWCSFKNKIINDDELRAVYIDRTDGHYLSKSELQILVRQFPISHLARNLKIGLTTMYHYCAENGIELPPRGYWEGKLQPGDKTMRRKFEIPKLELEKMVWEHPLRIISRKYGVSDNAIIKRCKILGVIRPGKGYWLKK